MNFVQLILFLSLTSYLILALAFGLLPQSVGHQASVLTALLTRSLIYLDSILHPSLRLDTIFCSFGSPVW